jgi:hypothetical protein
MRSASNLWLATCRANASTGSSLNEVAPFRHDPDGRHRSADRIIKQARGMGKTWM